MGAEFGFARRGIIFIVSGPSGAGKSTLVAAILGTDLALALSISCTTRAPRPSECDGREYRFVDRDEFARRRDTGDFAEWAAVHGAWYGTVRAPLDAAVAHGRDMLLDIDVQGARHLKRRYQEAAVAVMVLPPSWEELERRLRARRTEDEATTAQRLARARDEARALGDYDYRIVNRDRRIAAAELEAIIRAERTRVARIIGGSAR